MNTTINSKHVKVGFVMGLDNVVVHTDLSIEATGSEVHILRINHINLLTNQRQCLMSYSLLKLESPTDQVTTNFR